MRWRDSIKSTASSEESGKSEIKSAGDIYFKFHFASAGAVSDLRAQAAFLIQFSCARVCFCLKRDKIKKKKFCSPLDREWRHLHKSAVSSCDVLIINWKLSAAAFGEAGGKNKRGPMHTALCANTITSVKGYQLRFIANSQQFFTLYDRLKPLFCVSYAAFNVCYLTGPWRDSANLERPQRMTARDFLLSATPVPNLII